MREEGRFSPGAPLRKLALGVMIAAVPSVAFAAQVKGRIVGADKLMNAVWNEAKEVAAHRFTWREPSPTVRAEFRNLFAFAPKEVCIAAVASAEQKAASVPLLVTVGGGRTTPVTLVVAPGTRLHFENHDPFPHKLYAVGQTTFPAAEQASMAARDWTAPGPGKYEIRDELSPSVRSWVVVDPNVAAVTFPARDGSFVFGDLPPGEYTVKAFFEGAPVGTPKPLVVGNGNMDMKEPLPVAQAADKPAAPAGKK
jgi:plastocyanin